MLHYETIEPDLLELLNDLMSETRLREFKLVGGTALALQIGHRKSNDIDLFSCAGFTSDSVLRILLKKYQVQLLEQLPQTLLCSIKNIRVDFIRFSYPFIRPIIEKDGIRMASMEDIAAMKLDAIAGRGSKKDFYDLYFLLRLYDIESLLSFYKEMYPHQTTFHVVKSMVYFKDAEREPNPLVIDKKITWNKVKSFISKAIGKL